MTFARVPTLLALMAGLVACSDTSTPTEDNEGEVITTVALTFSPQGGGDDVVATWDDPENDGSPVIDDIVLADGTTYALAVRFLNALEDPAEDITVEIGAEDDEHQVFFTGTAFGDDLLTHAYADEDAQGHPVGLDSDITTVAAGSGTFIVTLRHLPPVEGEAVKTGTLADDLAAGGFSDLPGATDVQVTFPLLVE